MRIVPAIPGARQAEQQRRLPFELERHPAQHIAHQWLVDKVFAKCLPLMGMIQRGRERAAHQPVAAQCTVKARQAAHLQDLAHTLALFA
ncbi:hypothetical protein D3C81_1778010 [compost metagenome]